MTTSRKRRAALVVAVIYPPDLEHSALVAGTGSGQLLAGLGIPFMRHGRGFVVPRRHGVDVAAAVGRLGGTVKVIGTAMVETTARSTATAPPDNPSMFDELEQAS